MVRRLPRALAIDVELFASGGLAVLDAIEARGFDVFSGRPSLSRSTKLRLIARAAAVLGMNSVARGLFRASSMGWYPRRCDTQIDHSSCPPEVSHTGLEDSQ